MVQHGPQLTKAREMLDLNNRPGGPNLIVTAKTAHKVHFLDAETLTLSKTIDMPGSTHELALSSDGRTAYGTVYGEGIFARNANPDRRIAVSYTHLTLPTILSYACRSRWSPYH